jgi:hypothetical protein
MKEFFLIIGGCFSGFILSWLQYKYIWSSQKQFEIKYSILNDAIKALSLYESDALNTELQNQKVDNRMTQLRPKTEVLMEKSRGMVFAFFSRNASEAFNKALNYKIGPEDAPGDRFHHYLQIRKEAIAEMSHDMKPASRKLWLAISKKFHINQKMGNP